MFREGPTEGLLNASYSTTGAIPDASSEEAYDTVFGPEDLVDVGDKRRFLMPGDLIEYQSV